MAQENGGNVEAQYRKICTSRGRRSDGLLSRQQSGEPALPLVDDVLVEHLPSSGAVIVDIDLGDSLAVATLAEPACPVDVAPVHLARVRRPPQLAAVVVRVADVDDFLPAAHVDWAARVVLG